jgi:hypothetical protein
MRPHIFPAMGSHGAATAEGQAEILAKFGITEATVDCPVVSCLDVVSLGCTTDGIEALMPLMKVTASCWLPASSATRILPALSRADCSKWQPLEWENSRFGDPGGCLPQHRNA